MFFDHDPQTLATSNAVNPLVLDLVFDPPILAGLARIYPSYSTYSWRVLVEGDDEISLPAIPPGRWSILELPTSREIQEIRIELRRLERDDVVHLNELEIYALEESSVTPETSPP